MNLFDYIFELSTQLNLDCIEKNIEPYDIYEADEAFVCATPFCILPVQSLNGKLIQNSNNISFITDESTLEVPINNYDFIDKSDLNKKEIYFGIRPEHIYFKKLNEEDFDINLRADLSEYIGHEQIVTLDYSNQEILAKFPSTIKIELEKEMKLYFDLKHTSLFDLKTKERL